MTWGGWICMLSAIGFVATLFGLCCWKIATGAKDDAGESADALDAAIAAAKKIE